MNQILKRLLFTFIWVGFIIYFPFPFGVFIYVWALYYLEKNIIFYYIYPSLMIIWYLTLVISCISDFIFEEMKERKIIDE